MKLTRLAPLFALPLALAACSDKDTGVEPGEETGTVVIQFDNVVSTPGGGGMVPLVLDTDTYTNAAGNSYSVSLLEYVVSNLALVAESGSFARDHASFLTNIKHYRNQSDDATREVVLTDVPAGDYSDLNFTWGIPASENLAGTLPDLDLLGMAWPAMLGGGYHYMRHEGAYVPTGGGTANYTTHLGPSRGNDYSFDVSLDLNDAALARHGFEVTADDTVSIMVYMDVNEFYEDEAASPTHYDFNDYGVIMPDTTAQAVLQANGSDVFSVGSVTP